MEYGSKDIMRMKKIREHSNGDKITAYALATDMAKSIESPGKAMARANAACVVFGKYSAIAAEFYERAYSLGGENVQAEASLNPIEDIDQAYIGIPKNELPASRRSNTKYYNEGINRRIKVSNLMPLNRINLVKKTGKNFNIYDNPIGTIEVWQTSDKKYRLIWTSGNEPNYTIGEKHEFKYGKQWITWTMIDYIEAINISNLIPLYGKSLTSYRYN